MLWVLRGKKWTYKRFSSNQSPEKEVLWKLSLSRVWMAVKAEIVNSSLEKNEDNLECRISCKSLRNGWLWAWGHFCHSAYMDLGPEESPSNEDQKRQCFYSILHTRSPVQSTCSICFTCAYITIPSDLLCIGMYCSNTKWDLDTRCLCRACNDRNRLGLRWPRVQVMKDRWNGECDLIPWPPCILRWGALAMAMRAEC